MLQLYTFVISHFSEKVRWALDLEGLPYVEKRLLPGPHLPVIRSMAPGTSVPVLRDGAKVVQGSSAILDHLVAHHGARRIAASPERVARSAEIEALADQAFGLGIQRILYSVMLPDRRAVTRLWTQDGPFWGSAFYALAYPGVARVVSRMYKTQPEAVARAQDRFREAMGTVDRQLAAAPYLDGDAPGRADITVAALLAPLCRPPEHLVRWPAIPGALAPFVAEFEGRPTWNHVLRMYREHRRPVAPNPRSAVSAY